MKQVNEKQKKNHFSEGKTTKAIEYLDKRVTTLKMEN